MRERHCSEWSTAHSRPTLVVTTSPPSAHPNCSKSFLRSGARRTCRNPGTGGGTGTASCGCNTGRSDSNATAIVFKCVRSQFAAACFVQRTAVHIQSNLCVHGGLHGIVDSCTQRGEGHAVLGHLLPLLDVASKQTEHVQITGGEVSHIAHWPLRPCYLQGVVEMAHGLRLVGRSWNVRLATSVLAPGPDGGLDPYHMSCSTMRPLSSFSHCLCSPCSSTWRSLTHIGGRGISVSLSTAVTVIDHRCHRECSHSSDATFHETRTGSSAAVAPGGARVLLPQWASVRFHLPPFSVCLLGHFERSAHYTPCLPLRSGRWCSNLSHARALPSLGKWHKSVPRRKLALSMTRCHANSLCSLTSILAQACNSANIVAPALDDFANTHGCGLNRARRDRTRPEYQRVPKHPELSDSLTL